MTKHIHIHVGTKDTDYSNLSDDAIIRKMMQGDKDAEKEAKRRGIAKNTKDSSLLELTNMRRTLKELSSGPSSQWQKAKDIEMKLAKLCDTTRYPEEQKAAWALCIEAGKQARTMKNQFYRWMKETSGGMVTHKGNPVYLD